MWYLIVSIPDLCTFIYFSQEKSEKRRLFKKVSVFCEEKNLKYLLGYFGMLNPKTNVGKLKNGVFTI